MKTRMCLGSGVVKDYAVNKTKCVTTQDVGHVGFDAMLSWGGVMNTMGSLPESWGPCRKIPPIACRAVMYGKVTVPQRKRPSNHVWRGETREPVDRSCENPLPVLVISELDRKREAEKLFRERSNIIIVLMLLTGSPLLRKPHITTRVGK